MSTQQYPNSQSYGGLGNYSRSQNPQQAPSVSRYGQSVSSENLDYNNLPPYPTQSSYGCPPAPYYSNYCNQLDVNDPRLLQQVDQIVANLVECKRPILRRQVITVPAQCPGRVAYIHRRLPTPPPDIIERITVIKPPRDVVNLCIEKPSQPGPCYQERNVCGRPRKPIIQPRIINVNPRHNPCQPCQPCPPCPPQPCQPCGPNQLGQQCPPCPASFQAQVPLSPSPSQTNLSSAVLTQPSVTQQAPAFTQQPVYSQTQQYQPPAFSQAAAYPQAAYGQQAAAYPQQAGPAFSQAAAYPQAAYGQQAAPAFSQAAVFAQQAAAYPQQAAAGYPQQAAAGYPQAPAGYQ